VQHREGRLIGVPTSRRRRRIEERHAQSGGAGEELGAQVGRRSGQRSLEELANDPERNAARSLWLLPDGGDQLLRFASLASSPLQFIFVRLLADHAGTLHVIENGKLSRVVPL
jgi:hypothetical protein